MKFIRRPLAVIALALVSSLAFGGCVAESSDSDTSGPEASPPIEVVRHNEEELSKLAPGESLRLDLTLADKAYAITYTHRQILERVTVVARDGEHRLTEWAAQSIGADDDVEKQLVLRADPALDASSAESVATPDTPVSDCAEDVGELEQGLASRIIVSCRCPCCIRVGNVLVCCG